MQRRHARAENSVLAGLAHDLLHFLIHLRDDFLDARRVDAPVEDEPLHGLARDLAADGVEAGEHHRAGRVVNQHRHARQRLERADVPAFAANDAAL